MHLSLTTWATGQGTSAAAPPSVPLFATTPLDGAPLLPAVEPLAGCPAVLRLDIATQPGVSTKQARSGCPGASTLEPQPIPSPMRSPDSVQITTFELDMDPLNSRGWARQHT